MIQRGSWINTISVCHIEMMLFLLEGDWEERATL